MNKVHFTSLIEYFRFILVSKNDKYQIKRILKHIDIKDLELIYLIIDDELDRRNRKCRR